MEENKNYNLLGDYVVEKLESRGVTIESMAEEAYNNQLPYKSDIKFDSAVEVIRHILYTKREVQFAILTGIAIDQLTEQKEIAKVDPILQFIIETDQGLFGADEVLSMAIPNTGGSIALSNHFYIDKTKPGIVGKLNDIQQESNYKVVHTFLDDLVGGIIAKAAAQMAHDEEKLDSKIIDMLSKKD